MVAVQILSKVLATKDDSIIKNNGLTYEYFPGYESELGFIDHHITVYGNVPDTATFLAEFPDFEIVDVTESDRYLLDTIREEYLYAKSVPVIKKAAELLKSDANAAAQYMIGELPNLQPNYTTPAVDIAHDDSRVKEFIERSNSKDAWCIPTGFEELDDIVGGWETSEEFVVFFARTNQGKSWILVKTVEHAWQIGKNVGYISPEMSANKLAYRFDTLHNNFSNTALMRGDQNTITAEEYQNYMNELAERKNVFLVSTPADFNKQITVSKLRNFVIANKLDMLAIDGITYMTDERYKRGDNKTTSLTNISEDLMQLSCDLNIPILVVVQSNRGGVKEEENATPELEDIRDSDGISHNATKVIALKQKEQNLIMSIKKSRYGRVGDKLTYRWDIDKGEFEWMADINDAAPTVKKEERKRQIKEEYEPKGKVVF